MSSFSNIISGNKLVLIDFYADWCAPCKMMTPILKQVKETMGDTIKILKIDVDKNQRLAAAQNVRGVPTLVLFKDGKQLWRQSGVVQAQDIIGVLKQYS